MAHLRLLQGLFLLRFLRPRIPLRAGHNPAAENLSEVATTAHQCRAELHQARAHRVFLGRVIRQPVR